LVAGLKWWAVAVKDIFAEVLGFKPRLIYVIAGCCWLLGQYLLLARKKFGELLFFNGVAGLLLIAAVFRKYPFGERPILFSAPFFLAVIAHGIASVSKLAVSLTVVIMAVLMASQLYATREQYEGFAIHQHFRPLLETMSERYKGEEIQVNGYASFAWHYYSHRFSFNGRTTMLPNADDSLVRAIETAHRPTWFVWSHFNRRSHRLFLETMRTQGEIVHDFHFPQDPRTRVALFKPAGYVELHADGPGASRLGFTSVVSRK
jgi:hypothetical protein